MTWIVGRTVPFGYSMALSDIRLTLSDGAEVDCLQKIYAVGPFIAMGFAGSVTIGFAMVDRLRQLLGHVEPGMAWEPDVVAQWWPQDAREVFEACRQEERDLGCHLLMAGAHPNRNNGDVPWAMSYVYRFRSPDFVALLAGADEIVSIGSGEGVSEYSEALRRLGTDEFSYFQLEVVGPGGSALGLMESISHAIGATPQPGISQHLHVCVAMRGQIRLGNNDRRYIGESTPQDFVMPRVAQSLEQLEAILSARGQALSRARC
jgi:hypothetical protein